MKWQLIETAPKDGTEILACEARSANIEFVRFYDPDNTWIDRCADDFRATHWMPLPEPPKESE